MSFAAEFARSDTGDDPNHPTNQSDSRSGGYGVSTYPSMAFNPYTAQGQGGAARSLQSPPGGSVGSPIAAQSMKMMEKPYS